MWPCEAMRDAPMGRREFWPRSLSKGRTRRLSAKCLLLLRFASVLAALPLARSETLRQCACTFANLTRHERCAPPAELAARRAAELAYAQKLALHHSEDVLPCPKVFVYNLTQPLYDLAWRPNNHFDCERPILPDAAVINEVLRTRCVPSVRRKRCAILFFSSASVSGRCVGACVLTNEDGDLSRSVALGPARAPDTRLVSLRLCFDRLGRATSVVPRVTWGGAFEQKKAQTGPRPGT